MAKVTIIVVNNGRGERLRAMDKHIITKFSKAAKDLVNSKPPRTDVQLPLQEVDAKVVGKIVDGVLKDGEKFVIRGFTFEDAPKIMDAIAKLGLTIPQPHVEGYMKHYISRQYKLRIEDIIVIEKSFGHLGDKSDVWNQVVHAVAWKLTHPGFYMPEEADVLEQGLKKYSNLHDKITKLSEEFESERLKFEAREAERKAEWEAREAKKAGMEKLAEVARRVREHKEDVALQTKNGERVASNATLDFINRDHEQFSFKLPKRKERVMELEMESA